MHAQRIARHLLRVTIALTTFAALRTAQDAAAPEAKEALPQPIHHEVNGTVEADGRTLDYTLTLAETPILDDEGETTAYFTSFAYTVDAQDDTPRPVTFAFNGGPGSSSYWLHMGLLGPKRAAVPSDARNAGAAPYPLVDNPSTLLTETDLVFVDPVGTGFSHAVGDAEDADFWGVDEDVDSVARFIQAWLTENRRWNSPKFVLGESYGGVRGALLTLALKYGRASVALNGIVFISPAFDIQFVDGGEDDLTYVTALPTYAATALYHGVIDPAPADREAWLREVRAFAGGPYLEALFAGASLPASRRAEVVERLAAYTGLSADYLERSNLRVSASRFRKELLRSRGLVLGRLDMRYRGSDVDGVGDTPDSDPMMASLGSAYTACFLDYVQGAFGEDLPGRPYHFSGVGTFGRWKRSARDSEAFAGYLDTVPALAAAMRDNPDLSIFCANGWFDVATTVFASEYNLARPGIDPARVTFHAYEAGHMMYVHQPSLEELVNDLREFYRRAR